MKKKLFACSNMIMLLIISLSILMCKQRDNIQELKIGVIFPLTGENASYGEKGQKAINIAVADVNKESVAHKKVTVIYEDSRAEPTSGATAIQKLISIDNVPAVIGDIVSAVTLAAAPIAEKNKVVLLSPTSSAPAITEAGQFIYRIWPSDLAEGKAIAEFARKKGYARAAILHLNNDYGIAIAKIFKETFEAEGAQVVLHEGYLETTKDFRAVLTKLVKENPEVVYVAGYFGDTARILKQAREIGYKSQFLATTAIEDNKFIEIAGDATEGVIYPLATGFDAKSDNPEVARFVEEFQKQYGYEPGWVEAQSYDAFMLIYKAASTIDGKIDGLQIKRFFDSMSEFEGVTGKFKFDENGDVSKSVVFKTIKDGKFQAL